MSHTPTTFPRLGTQPDLTLLPEWPRTNPSDGSALNRRTHTHVAQVREEVKMSLLLVACIFAAVPPAILGLAEAQARLERWDQRRHAQD